jgi:HAE1 family hydrophobic/amphiphilic exporter-1
MEKITRFSVKYPVSVLMIILAIILLGYISYDKLGTDLLPNLNNPKLFIELQAGEQPPEEIEKQYVDNIESQVSRLEGVSQVSSVCKVGSAKINVEYSWDQDMDAAFLELQKILTNFSQDDNINELNISRYDPNSDPVMLIAMSHNSIDDMNELRKTAQNYVRNELIRIEGIADVQIAGQEEEEVIINTDNYLLQAYGLTADNIVQKINNLNRNVSGGTITEGGFQYTVKGVKIIDKLNDIANIIVGFKKESSSNNEENTGDDVPVFLKDVATVKMANKEPDNIVLYNGARCLGLSIYKETKYNTVKAVEQLNSSLKEIQKALPGYEFHIIDNQGLFISEAISEVKNSALTGIVLAMIILFVFLRRINTTLIVSISIPISIIATFNLMFFNHLTINIMTLGGLALGAGMLVDNAIVVMENIFRNLEQGMSPKEAAIKGTAEVGGAITASTITTIVVFLPIVYLQGASGELFKDQAWTVAFSLLSSLFVAILVIPMLSSRFIKKIAIKENKPPKHFLWYGNLLEKILIHKWKVITLSFLLVLGTTLLIPYIGSDFMPKTETKEFTVKLKLEEGTKLQKTAEITTNVEKIIKSLINDDIDFIYSHVGPFTTSGTDKSVLENDNTSYLKIKLKEDSNLSVDNLISHLNNSLNNNSSIEFEFVRDESALTSILGTEEAPIVVEVIGENFDIIENLSNQIIDQISDIEGLYDISSSIEKGSPEVDIKIDRLKAGILNIDVNSVSNQIKDLLSGKKAGSIDKDGELKEISINLPEVSINNLEEMEIKNSDKSYRLDEIADISLNYSPKQILRSDQSRISKISAQLKKNIALDKVVKKINEKIKHISFPANYRAKITGEEAKRKESFGSLAFALILSIILVYMVMASQFESLIHPFTILLTIPLAGVGSLLAFIILGKSLNIMAYIGIIMLAGIAVNDSIILVDAINRLKAKGTNLKEAIVQAGMQRIRPIIMTSLTTILALLPLTLGFGESASLRSPMAIAVIGGLITSTLLTLVVIPCFYYVIELLFSKNK